MESLNVPSHPIRVHGLSKTFHASGSDVRALQQISFEVPSERFVCLVGPSGCGKSTLLGIVAGLMPYDAGTVEIDGRRVHGPNPEQVGMVFQEPLLLPWKNARENVEFPLRLQGMPADERRQRAEDMLALVGLTGFDEAYPHELSRGMRQRAALARSLVHDPALILMDEPFASLDEQSRLKMCNVLLEIWERTRKSVLFVTHSLVEALYLADVVLVMSARPGRIVERIDVPLPRPRTHHMLGSAELGEARNRIWDLIAADDDGEDLP
jgi:NitT/TauT family transport system ATP-binding protein